MAPTGLGPALGTRIRAQREALGWSQAKLAEVVDLTPNYVGALERGEALPTVQTLVVIGKALNTSPAGLLGEPQGRDAWLEDLVAVAVTVPLAQRRLVLALVRTVAAGGTDVQGARRARTAKRDATKRAAR